MSPTHMISSMSAIQELHVSEQIEITLLVYWPGGDTKLNKNLVLVIKNLTRAFPNIKTIITVFGDDKRTLSEHDFQEIYYPHDVVGNVYQSLCKLFPKATRICYGDGLGIVYEKYFHLGKLLKYSWREKFSQKLEKIRYNLTQKPHKSILILPVDQSGQFLKNVALTVCSKQAVLGVINKCIFGTKSLHLYIRTLISKNKDKKKFLLLTENIAEGKFLDFNREIEMYSAIIKKYCPRNSIIFLKSHPGETLPRNKAIKISLKKYATIIELNKKFSRYPIEIWKELVTNSVVISMSYPRLSLKYLYNIDVINPMDNAFIEKWFPRWTWESYKNSIKLYSEPLKKLEKWNGKAILWSGTNKYDKQ